MKIKITVYTPRNQAAKSMQSQKNALLGLKHKRRIVEEKLLSHNIFYWILEIEPGELVDITRKCARGEVIIRKFYTTIFKLIAKANKIAEKSGKAGAWFKRFIRRRLKKMSKSDEQQEGLINSLEEMNDEEFKDFIKIHDKEEMQEFLKRDLFEVEEV